jgi:hypothetical protein
MSRMKDSDKIPRLFVETPTISLSMVRPVEAAIEIIATFTFSFVACAIDAAFC